MVGGLEPAGVPNIPYFIETSSANMTTTKNPAVTKMVFTNGGLRMFSSRRFGFCFMTPGRGGSEHNAIDANVSMITLIHKSCSTVNGALTLNNKMPRNVIARALTLIVS